jgi:hypothetical protein
LWSAKTKTAPINVNGYIKIALKKKAMNEKIKYII